MIEQTWFDLMTNGEAFYFGFIVGFVCAGIVVLCVIKAGER